MASKCGEEEEESRVDKLCSKSRKCSKSNYHSGRCDSKRAVVNPFWNRSPIQVGNAIKREARDAAEAITNDCDRKKIRVEEREASVHARESELIEKERKIHEVEERANATRLESEEVERRKEAIEEELRELEGRLDSIVKEYEKVKTLLEQRHHAKARRKSSATTFEMVNNPKSSTRYRRRQETRNILEFIHGGEQGAIYGAWDFIASCAKKEIMEKLITCHKRGRSLQGVFRKAMKEYGTSEEALKQAVSIKYQAFLSSRKFQLICKTQSSVFNAEKDLWLPRNVKCAGVNVAIPRVASDEKVDKFVKSLDIEHECEIPIYSKVSRTVTGLVFMTLDLHLRLPYLRNQLIWFNENTNHFIVQFSDDGAPETSDPSMSIGSLTVWNFGDHVRSRDFQYLLHCLSVYEKDRVMEDPWKQHTEEMLMLEGNVVTICGQQCTLEFQPSADQSWQSWGNDTWNPPSMKKRKADLLKLNQCRDSLSKSLSQAKKDKKELSFMAENGIRKVVYPRIGEFADRQRPELVQNEINTWQHLLNVIYREALQRDLIEDFLEVLS
ncbi:uncharacterized protein LOC111343412 [Stylophora pistillata]|uniref:uncharacterized protein LOC111343412 n=1 Tax=Stylophora pistillata TaxID=50429 RepID=UPI000C04F563|nr:uncharacterized protein LOC111343412 [Stylophora pistillata]